MIADDADAVTFIFRSMMRNILRSEKVGEDTLSRTVELARKWGTSPAADARLAVALRELHGEQVDTDEAREVADEGIAILAENGFLPERDARRGHRPVRGERAAAAGRGAQPGRVRGDHGRRIVTEPASIEGRVIGYCRVSSGDQKGDLDRQAVRIVEGANAQGFAVGEIVKEIGSGLNGKRRKLHGSWLTRPLR